MLAFALLNFLVAIALAVIRKRTGTFGKMPVRTENEFTNRVVGSEGAAGSNKEEDTDGSRK